METNKTLLALLYASALALTACGGGSSSSSTTEQPPANETSGSENSGNSTPTLLQDTSWSAGQDRVLGLSYGGTRDNPVISMLKAKPVEGQDGDLFTLQSVAYPQTDFSITRTIDNGRDRQDYQKFDIISSNGKDYVIACQDGNNSVGYAQSTKLHIWESSAPDDVEAIGLSDINGNFHLRGCNSLDALFTQGSSTAMEAKVYVVGYSEPDNAGFSGDRLVQVSLVFDTTQTIDQGAISFLSGEARAAAQNLYQAGPNDSLDAVAAYGNNIYFFTYEDDNAYNTLYYMNGAAANPITKVVSQSVNDVFAGVAQQMSVKDMTLVQGINDHDLIYLVSDSDAPGIAVAGHRPFVAVPARTLAKTSDTLAQRCSDVITANPANGYGQKMWCYDATEAGKVLELQAPGYP